MTTYLGVTFLGKKIKPYALAVSLTMFIQVYMLVTNVAAGELLDGWHGDTVAVVAGISALWLIFGWWWQKQSMLEWGLLLSAGVWATVATSVGFEFGVFYHNALLAGTWVIASIGSWLLERENSE